MFGYKVIKKSDLEFLENEAKRLNDECKNTKIAYKSILGKYGNLSRKYKKLKELNNEKNWKNYANYFFSNF